MLIAEGFRFMATGMTVVFCVLTLLVLSMHLSAYFFARFAKYFPEEPSAIDSAGPDDGDLVAIAVALAAIAAREK